MLFAGSKSTLLKTRTKRKAIKLFTPYTASWAMTGSLQSFVDKTANSKHLSLRIAGTTLLMNFELLNY